MTLNESILLKTYSGISFDSEEEILIAIWLEELQEAGIVEKWEKCEESIPLTSGLSRTYIKRTKLKTKVKEEEKVKIILRPSVYTPDFKVLFITLEFLGVLYDCNFSPDRVLYTNDRWRTFIEVKPRFDQQNMERLFINNQKFIWENHRIFVNLVEPTELFRRTFLPQKLREYFQYKKTTKNWKKGDWKVKWIPKTLNQFLCQQK